MKPTLGDRMLRVYTACALLVAWALPAAAATCDPHTSLGVSRTVEIDAAGGPVYGDITKARKEPSFLKPKEVVLTFDDGPMPWITSSILDTLDRHCTRATFFSVGRMALAYPESVREVLRRGHTLGTHTWSHPLNIARIRPDKATDEIERGFAAVAMAAGMPIAPFFRFPGLSDSGTLLNHLQGRGIATFTVDVVSNDSYIGDPHRLARQTIERTEARQGGIILFHDIKTSTAKALPTILSELKARGFQVVHLRATDPVNPVKDYDGTLGPILAKAEIAAGGRRQLRPFFGDAATVRPEPNASVTRLSANPLPRVVEEVAGASTQRERAGAAPSGTSAKRPPRPQRQGDTGWSTGIQPDFGSR